MAVLWFSVPFFALNVIYCCFFSSYFLGSTILIPCEHIQPRLGCHDRRVSFVKTKLTLGKFLCLHIAGGCYSEVAVMSPA